MKNGEEIVLNWTKFKSHSINSTIHLAAYLTKVLLLSYLIHTYKYIYSYLYKYVVIICSFDKTFASFLLNLIS